MKGQQKSQKVTQDQLAEFLGVTQTTVGRWLKGTIPSGDDLVKLANRFNVSIDWLMGREVGIPAEAIREEPRENPIVDEVLMAAADIRERMRVLEVKVRKLRK